MHASRSSWLALVLACAVVAQRSPGASTPRFQVGPAPSEPELSAQRERVDRANSALSARDFATASSIVADVVALLLERAESERGERWLTLLDDAGRTAFYAQDVLTAKRALQVVLEVRSRTLPDEHPDLQAARANLAEERTRWPLS